jgi:hypothetical protein
MKFPVYFKPIPERDINIAAARHSHKTTKKILCTQAYLVISDRSSDYIYIFLVRG